MKSDKHRTAVLTTDFEGDIPAGGIPFAEYPRPQLRRASYLCLNGRWSFSVRRNGRTVYKEQITVPFVPESRLSGVKWEIAPNDTLIYTRRFTAYPAGSSGRVLLHIGACDQYAAVFVNDRPVGEHAGGYLPFSFDVTDALLPGENTLRVEARDPLDTDLPYGKQTNKPGGMWYTKISGIWQTVWMENVPDDAIQELRITPDHTGVDITVIGGTEEKILHFGGRDYPFRGDRYRLEVPCPILWTPANPHLYEFSLTSGADTVTSYFGLRTFGMERRGGRPLLCLNGEPIFCHGLLDQGYFSDGIFSPASPRGYEEDIRKMKACGFNMLRKHIKTEPDLFYYYCDKYGMLVFQDMINSGKYSFLIDTALPTVFLRKGISHRASARRRQYFTETCRGIQQYLYNHPSVVYYTIFNEGWGQFDAGGQYRALKAADPTRVYDTTSGWFKVEETDVESDHVYFKPVKLKPTARPMILSEFGGYSCRIDGHAFCPDKAYGYRYFLDRQTFEDALVTLYEDEILPAVEGGLCAAVLTQLSDVEEETNGLLTYDRRVQKVDGERMHALAQKLHATFSRREADNTL